MQQQEMNIVLDECKRPELSQWCMGQIIDSKRVQKPLSSQIPIVVKLKTFNDASHIASTPSGKCFASESVCKFCVDNYDH